MIGMRWPDHGRGNYSATLVASRLGRLEPWRDRCSTVTAYRQTLRAIQEVTFL